MGGAVIHELCTRQREASITYFNASIELQMAFVQEVCLLTLIKIFNV